MANNTTPVFVISQNATDPTDTAITIGTSDAWHGNGNKTFSLDQTGSNQGITSALSADGAALTLNKDGSISYDPTASSLLSGLSSGTTVTDTFKYTVVVGNKSIETVNVSVGVTGTYVYMPTDHVYSPTLESPEPEPFGDPGMFIDASNTGILEFDAANVSATIASHPITSATLDFDEISFLDTGSNPFAINIYAFNGTGNITQDLAEVGTGTLVGTTQVSSALGNGQVNLNTSALNQILGHGSDLGFALVAQNPNGSLSALSEGPPFGNNLQLHLTA